MDGSAIEIVAEFFRRMNTNDFQSAGLMLSDDYPLSGLNQGNVFVVEIILLP